MNINVQTYSVPLPAHAVGPLYHKTAEAQAKKFAKRQGLTIANVKIIDGEIVFTLTSKEKVK